MAARAVRVRKSKHKHLFRPSWKETGWSLNLFNAHGLEEGQFYITPFHFSTVALNLQDLSMKDLAEAKHLHPLRSG